MLGISIYPNKASKKEIIDYVKLASKYNFKRVFMNLLSTTKSKETIKEEFSEIIGVARKANMEVMLDIAPSVFDHLKISYDDLSFFNELGATGIRLDLMFNSQQEAIMTHNKYDLDIEINISTGTKYLDHILSYEPNRKKLLGCHNFYPMEFSGLGLDNFIDMSLQFQEQNIRSAAFVTSQAGKMGPWPVMDGLPTLEMHRNLPIEVQVKHLKMLDVVDDIIIGNMFASEEELKAISSLPSYPIFKVKVAKTLSDTESKIIFDVDHIFRGDYSDQLIRSSMPRITYKGQKIAPENLVETFSLGDICIPNDNYEHYRGELQIVTDDIPNNHKRRNLVARIIDEEVFLLDYLLPWSAFKIVQ